MAEKMNKLQIRAEFFSAVNDICESTENQQAKLDNIVKVLTDVEDKDFLAKLLLKEFISNEDAQKSAIISLLLINCIPVEILEKNLWSNLALKTISDKKKYQLIDIMKSLGKFIEYDKYLDYFDEPQTVIEMDTHKLLDNAMLNPEAQIDFLDFISTLATPDKILLINSMAEDYPPDDRANILFPILLYEQNKEILEAVLTQLIESKSPLAYQPVKRFFELTDDENLKKLSNRGLKELKLAGVTEEKARSYYQKKFLNSILYVCHTSLIDGKGNQGLLFSRIRYDNSIQMFCVVINDTNGIMGCFGFNTISELEFRAILKKFYMSETPASITFETAMSWLNEAEEISYKNKNTLPYEYVCWKEILFDVEVKEAASNDIIQKALSILPNIDFEFEDIFETHYLDKMFLTKNDNENFSDFIDSLDERLCAEDEFDVEKIENYIKENLDKIFDKETQKLIIERILKTAFILMSNSNLKYAGMIYKITQNADLLKQFYYEMTKKSVFEYYREEYADSVKESSENIFLRNAVKNQSKINRAKLMKLLHILLEKWGRDD